MNRNIKSKRTAQVYNVGKSVPVVSLTEELKFLGVKSKDNVTVIQFEDGQIVIDKV